MMADSNSDSLSPDQLDKVMNFQEVSGCTDVCVCVSALATAHWDVEKAVHAHLTEASSVTEGCSGDSNSAAPQSEIRRRTGDCITSDQFLQPGSSSALPVQSANSSMGANSSDLNQSSSSTSSFPNSVTTATSATSTERFSETSSSTFPGNRGSSSSSKNDRDATPSPVPHVPLSASSASTSHINDGGGSGGVVRRLARWAFFLSIALPTRLFLSWPLRLCFWSAQSLLSMAYALLHSTSAAPDPTRDMEQFISTYEGDYPRVPHPTFCHSSYSQALNTAKQRLQFLLVYLHCRDHLNTDPFCRNVLSDSRLLNFISSNNILFWACDVALPEGYRVSQALREYNYPYLALVVVRGGRMSVVARLEGAELLQADHLLQLLTRHHDDSMPHVTAARLSRLERQQAVALRQEQDTAYEASLRADREKRRLKEEEREREREAILREERRAEREREYKRRLKGMIPEEPPADAAGALQLVVKLPHGERLERRFHASHPLSSLYCLVYSHEHAPDRFEITTNFPRKVVPCRAPLQLTNFLADDDDPQRGEESPQDGATTREEGEGSERAEGTEGEDVTFEQFGIAPRTVLFVKDLDA